ncbi:ClC family H(+)/Cl(-) exchange transporter, partial [Streptomyces sp. SID10244]|nr:ClC family H(+)/Cl(-) exchange transporter [Streptomyces sp. SID10244]
MTAQHDAGDPDHEPSAHAGVTEDILTGRTLWVILVLAAIAGALAGFVGGAFRWLLEHTDRWR